ncbi:sigma-70 family RNA polymerase sigma factor [Lentilactobacillus buchneri]|uniref:sigma-70 family RNA polymerase sigma factor n=2 Tax=Lentilactobacillus buchneri TaxID=1581 RepID=UPI0002D7CA58|nr:sigma-70 family RNA polymerase sigma factor [Lentilactobacillus buchneri]
MMKRNNKQIELYQDAFDFLLDGDHELVVYGVLKKLHISKQNTYYDDMVQEGMLSFVEKYIRAINLEKEPESYLAYIYRGVYWDLINYLHKQITITEHVEVPDDNVDPLAELPDGKNSASYYDTHILSRQLMTELNPKEIKYLVLAYDYGMNISEIAKECGVSRKCVHAWRKRVINKLQKNF